MEATRHPKQPFPKTPVLSTGNSRLSMHMEYMKAIYLVAELFFIFLLVHLLQMFCFLVSMLVSLEAAQILVSLSELNISDSFKYSSDGLVPTPSLPACPILVSLIWIVFLLDCDI